MVREARDHPRLAVGNRGTNRVSVHRARAREEPVEPHVLALLHLSSEQLSLAPRAERGALVFEALLDAAAAPRHRGAEIRAVVLAHRRERRVQRHVLALVDLPRVDDRRAVRGELSLARLEAAEHEPGAGFDVAAEFLHVGVVAGAARRREVKVQTKVREPSRVRVPDILLARGGDRRGALSGDALDALKVRAVADGDLEEVLELVLEPGPALGLELREQVLVLGQGQPGMDMLAVVLYTIKVQTFLQ